MSLIVDKAKELKAAIDNVAANATDEIAVKSAILYEEWNGNSKTYKEGQRLNYGGSLYKVLQAHTSQDDWAPDVAPSLFAKVLIPDASVIPEWEQPDSTNPYMAGDKVTHNGKTWVSDVDNNVWEPGATGTESLWKEV